MTQDHYLQTELEALIKADASMWQFLQRGSLDGCWYWDLENPEQEWMSPEFWALFGIDPHTKRHDPAEWQDMIFAEDRDVALENFQRHLEDPDHAYDQVVRYRHADGSTVWVRCRGIAIRDEVTGKPIRMLGAHNDLTATKAAERQLLVEKRAVEASNEELKTFAYSISHDMKSPSNTLRLILNELRTTQATRLDDEGHELLDMGVATIDRMQEMIEGVLRYTNMIELEHSRTAVDLNALVTDIISDLQGEIRAKDAQIVVHELPVIHGDRPLLRTLFLNLLSNA
ncbi:MAG: PAS domain-containing protein, partial [Gammaproteobacteria bacterium]